MSPVKKAFRIFAISCGNSAIELSRHSLLRRAGDGSPVSPAPLSFIRNENGSHNPLENMKMDDFMSGVAVMRKVLAETAP
jgi:N-carbamoyl-L-amino-acid hydrolase